jgi:glycosyltransferase involved in cell wall biosynthesis
VVSRTLQKYFRSKYRTEIGYVPNGAQVRTRCRSNHLEQFGLAAQKYAPFLGRLSLEKNCDLLIEAFKSLGSEVAAEFKLVLVGGFSQSNEYVNQLRRLGNKRIVFLDCLSGETLEQVLTNAALFVLPSDLEGMSLSLLEAMGAGLCVLASDVPENREVIADCGFTFKAGDVDDLRRMMALLLNNGRLREISGQKARASTAELFMGAVTSEIETVYRDLASHAVPQRLDTSEPARKSA